MSGFVAGGWRGKQLIVGAVLIALFVVLISRVVELQAMGGHYYRQLADDNRFFTITLPAERGVFTDRYGEVLVWNTAKYYEITNPQALFHQVTPILREEALQFLATDSGKVLTKYQRLYRYPEALAHVLGYVGEVTAEELAAKPGRSLDKVIGKSGLERVFDTQLQGIDGQAIYEIDAQGRRQRLLRQLPPQPGQVIATTLDPWLSTVAYQALDGHRGSVIIGDAKTGEILSLINRPSFDPNLVSTPVDDPVQERQRRSQVTQLLQDPVQPFFDRAVMGSYPPGSVFKLVTALAGLETQTLTAETTVDDQGTLKVGEFEYGNWYFRQYGRVEGVVNLVRALARSNDIFFYKAGEWIGPSKLAEMARLVGYGSVTGIELPGQVSGLIPDPEWKQKAIGEQWFLGNTYHMSIGQGDVLVSPIQVVQMVQTIANQGTLCRPTLVQNSPDRCREVGLTSEHVELVLQGMLDACSPTGTAFPFFPRNQERRTEGSGVLGDLRQGAVACKTGTAEFGGADAQGYRKTHGWLAATIEPQLNATPAATIDPAYTAWREAISKQGFPQRLVIVALVESDDQQPFQEGSRDAGAVVAKIFDWIETGITVPVSSSP